MKPSSQRGSGSQTITIPQSVIAACNRHNICRKSAFGSTTRAFDHKNIRTYNAGQNPDGLGSSIVGCQGKKGQIGQIGVDWPKRLPAGELVTPDVHMRTLTERIVTHLDEFGGNDAQQLSVQARETKTLDTGEYVQSAYFSFKLEAEKVIGTVIYVSNRMEGGTGKQQGNRVVGVYTFSAVRALHATPDITATKGTSTASAPAAYAGTSS